MVVIESNTINDRFRIVFQKSGLSQEKFASSVDMTRSEVANILYDKTSLKPHKIPTICQRHNIREEWLRDGVEPMQYPKSLGDEIGEIALAASRTNPEAAAHYFRHLFDGWSEAEILLLYELMRRKFPSQFPQQDDKKD